MKSFPIRSRVTATVEFRSNGALVDPSVAVHVRSPTGTVMFDYFGGFGGITRLSLGRYSFSWLLNESGAWTYRFDATGAYVGSDGDRTIRVDPTNFAASEIPTYTLTVTSPLSGANVDTVTTHVSVTASVSIPGSTPLRLYVDDVLSGDGGTVAAGANTGTLQPGARTIRAQVTAGASLVNSPAIPVTVRSAPVLAFSSLGTTVAAGWVRLEGTASDDGVINAASLGVLIDGVPRTTTRYLSEDHTWWTMVELNPSPATLISVTLTDATGLTVVQSQTVLVQALAIATPTESVIAVDEAPVVVTVTATPTVSGATPIQLYVAAQGQTGASASGAIGTVASGATTAELENGVWDITARMTVGGVIVNSPVREVTVSDQVPEPAIYYPTANQRVTEGTLAVLLDVPHASAAHGALTVQCALEPTFSAPVVATWVSGVRWTANLTIAGQTTHTVYCRAHDLSTPFDWISAAPVICNSLPNYVEFDTGGVNVSPAMTLAAGATDVVAWVHQGTNETVTGLTPTITSGAGTVRMTIGDGSPAAWARCRSINFGFDSTVDAGQQNAGAGYNRAPQNVTAIRYASNLTNIEYFFAGANALNGHVLTGALDLAGCIALRHVECFGAQLTSISLPTIASDTHPHGGAPHRLRLCLEGNRLTNLDLNPVAYVVYDLRSAVQQTASLTMSVLTQALRVLYHYCVRDQVLINHATAAQLPVIFEQWDWNTSQTGALTPVSTALESLQGYSNNWSSVDLHLATALRDIQLQNCGISTIEVDDILADVNAFASTGAYTLNLAGNGGPSPEGTISATALRARGWTVTLEAEVGGGVTSDNFNRADSGEVGNGWHGFNSGTGDIYSNALRRTDTGDYRGFVNPGGGALPADYVVAAVVPHATVQSGFWGLVGRWTGANGVRLLSTASGATTFANLTLGQASGYDTGNVTITADDAFPASWTVNQPHTIAIAMIGTLIGIYIDGVLVGHGTVTTNATATGTEYGCCGEGNNRLWDSIGTS